MAVNTIPKHFDGSSLSWKIFPVWHVPRSGSREKTIVCMDEHMELKKAASRWSHMVGGRWEPNHNLGQSWD